MSWMDSWSRPSKHQAVPAPFYLHPNTGEDIPYCKSCGRIIGPRRTGGAPPATSDKKKQAKVDSNAPITPVKYCSSRCRSQKPGKIDSEIEAAFVKFLTGEEPIPDHYQSKGAGKKKMKGDARILVTCDVIEAHVFGDRRQEEPEKRLGRKKNRASRVIAESEDAPEISSFKPCIQQALPNRPPQLGDWNDNDKDEGVSGLDLHARLSKSDYETVVDGDLLARMSVRSGTRIRPPQVVSEVNGSVGGEKGWAERIEETDEMREKRSEGQRKAHEKEMVRCAARRGVVFGFDLATPGTDDRADGNRRKCEAVMQGKVVEPSFAKGDWGVRWREEY
ncbi:hypothetical protein B0T22DRAFT_165368 [Podospora appendiculata]|uniref:Uncharacterized protein n=1 Tax=Podospora appendiculata TaxID=314037 RepID=A0AAE0XB17_9PEZI|nr:hypothetical protein B0T22DRAFT_165368 [Podospora appendiculata]